MAGDKEWWDCFARGAARAFWAETYMREVELLNDEESAADVYNPDAYEELSPGAGGEWMDYVPETPKSALKMGYKFTRDVRSHVSDVIWQEMEDELGCEDAGWYSAMPAMGHGVSIGDWGIDDDWIDDAVGYSYSEPTTDVDNDAYDAVRKAVKELEDY